MFLLKWFQQWRAKRDAAANARWNNFAQLPGQIFQIVSIRQKARTGLKAYVTHPAGGERFAVWIRRDLIPHTWPHVGLFVCVSGGTGSGLHHNEPVFYVDELFGTVDSEAHRGMLRHTARGDAFARANARREPIS